MNYSSLILNVNKTVRTLFIDISINAAVTLRSKPSMRCSYRTTLRESVTIAL